MLLDQAVQLYDILLVITVLKVLLGQLHLPDLYADKADILERLTEGLPGSSTSDKLDSLISEVDARLDELNSPVPEDAAFRKVKESCRNRILFQLNKIKSRCEKAGIQIVKRLFLFI